jgi:hypothetical protein
MRLAAVVYWTGTGVSFAGQGKGGVNVGGEPSAQAARC